MCQCILACATVHECVSMCVARSKHTATDTTKNPMHPHQQQHAQQQQQQQAGRGMGMVGAMGKGVQMMAPSLHAGQAAGGAPRAMPPMTPQPITPQHAQHQRIAGLQVPSGMAGSACSASNSPRMPPANNSPRMPVAPSQVFLFFSSVSLSVSRGASCCALTQSGPEFHSFCKNPLIYTTLVHYPLTWRHSPIHLCTSRYLNYYTPYFHGNPQDFHYTTSKSAHYLKLKRHKRAATMKRAATIKRPATPLTCRFQALMTSLPQAAWDTSVNNCVLERCRAIPLPVCALAFCAMRSSAAPFTRQRCGRR